MGSRLDGRSQIVRNNSDSTWRSSWNSYYLQSTMLSSWRDTRFPTMLYANQRAICQSSSKTWLLPEPRQPRGKGKTCLLKIVWRMLVNTYHSRVREMIINVLCVRRNTQRPRKMGGSSKGTRMATNIRSVMFICALAFLVKVACEQALCMKKMEKAKGKDSLHASYRILNAAPKKPCWCDPGRASQSAHTGSEDECIHCAREIAADCDGWCRNSQENM